MFQLKGLLPQYCFKLTRIGAIFFELRQLSGYISPFEIIRPSVFYQKIKAPNPKTEGFAQYIMGELFYLFE